MHLKNTLVATTYENRAEGCVERMIEYHASGHEPEIKGTIRYEFFGEVLPLPLQCQDFAMVALLFFAMGKGLDLHIRGPVSKRLLANLEEFQLAWNKWCPKQYVPVRLSADIELDATEGDDGTAVLAYSGGVDANFSLVHHLSRRPGRRTRQIKAAVLVHGFDLPLDQSALFDQAHADAQKILSTFGVPLTVVKTDWKKSVGADWEMEYGAALAACLFQFSGIAGAGLVGSDHDYGALFFPWGTNAVTSPLLNGAMSLEMDGQGFSRCEKVAAIADFPVMKDHLRVCYTHSPIPNEAANCGKCEKCLRTKMNFYANGLTPGKSLAVPHTLLDILFMDADCESTLSLHHDIQLTAKRNHITGPWMRAHQAAIFLNGLKVFLRHTIYRPLKRTLWARA